MLKDFKVFWPSIICFTFTMIVVLLLPLVWHMNYCGLKVLKLLGLIAKIPGTAILRSLIRWWHQGITCSDLKNHYSIFAKLTNVNYRWFALVATKVGLIYYILTLCIRSKTHKRWCTSHWTGEGHMYFGRISDIYCWHLSIPVRSDRKDQASGTG